MLIEKSSLPRFDLQSLLWFGILFFVLSFELEAATVQITSFGAVANDGRDDTNAFLSAAQAAGTNGTILIPGGVFDFSSQLNLTNDRIYQGQSGSVLRGRGPGGQLLYINGNNVSLLGLTIEGGGLFVDRSGGFNQNLVIDGNTFKTNTSGEHPSCITFTSGLQNSRITNNYFTGSSGFGIYGYNYNSLTIANNEFVNIGAGMHIDAFYNSGNLLVEQNYISGARGMGFEFQSTASNLKFFDNFYEKPNLSTNFNSNGNSMAFSLILDKSSNIEIKRNTVLAPERPDGVGTRIGFELGGDNTIVEENYINGVNHVAAMNDGVGTASVIFRKNRVLNYLQSWSCSFCSGNTRTWNAYDNGPNTSLSWDINRPRPGIGAKRYGGTNTPTPPPTTTTPLPPAENNILPAVAPTEPGLVYLSDLDFISSNYWGPIEKDESNGEQIASDGKLIQIGNRTYAKGLGAHASSSMIFNLDGKYDSFRSIVGIDGETQGRGSANLEVYADGVLIYQSGRMDGGDEPLSLDLNIRDKQELILKLTNAGDNFDFDHVSFGFARLIPTADTFAYISDLGFTTIANGWGPVEKDRSNGEALANDGRMITLNGKTYQKGIGVHANSEIRVDLNRKYSTFVADIGVDDEVNSSASWCSATVIFQIFNGNWKIYDSGIMTKTSVTKTISVDISQMDDIRLVVKSANDNIYCDHADWADAKVLR